MKIFLGIETLLVVVLGRAMPGLVVESSDQTALDLPSADTTTSKCDIHNLMERQWTRSQLPIENDTSQTVMSSFGVVAPVGGNRVADTSCTLNFALKEPVTSWQNRKSARDLETNMSYRRMCIVIM